MPNFFARLNLQREEDRKYRRIRWDIDLIERRCRDKYCKKHRLVARKLAVLFTILKREGMRTPIRIADLP